MPRTLTGARTAGKFRHMPETPAIASQFAHRKLTAEGEAKAKKIAVGFTELLNLLGATCPPGRELALAATHLEIACTFAKKAMAAGDGNHE